VIHYILGGKSVTFMNGSQAHQVSRDSINFKDVIAELTKVDPAPDMNVLLDLARPVAKVEREIRQAFEGSPNTRNYLEKRTVEVTRGGVFLDGVQMHGVLVDRMLEMVALGLPLGGMIRFMENLYMNPADFARDELYLWLENSDLPITEDGHFLAYKYVRSDFKDSYSGTFDNSPGQMVQLTGRHAVDPVRDNTCSYGLHFCSKSYLPSYSSGPVIVLLKINPADVVSIPSDYSNAKGRTWRYEVLRQVTEDVEGIRWAPLVGNDGSEYAEAKSDGTGYVEDENEDGIPRTRWTTPEGFEAEIVGPDEDHEFYWYVDSQSDYAEGYTFSFGTAEDAIAEAAGELVKNNPDDEDEYEDDPFGYGY
jgi:hypothetical protein